MGAAAALAPLASCGTIRPHQFRYRLTLTVDDNGRRLVASAVNQYSWVQMLVPGLSGGHLTHSGIAGEGVFLDLGADRVLVSIMHGWGGPGPDGKRTVSPDGWSPIVLFMKAFNLSPQRSDGIVDRMDKLNGVTSGPLIDLDITDIDSLPVLVTFADRLQPASVRTVDTTDLAATFGPGVRLARATVQLTGDPLFTEGLETKLPWLPGLLASQTSLMGNLTDKQAFNPAIANSVPAHLYGNSFIRKEMS